jgi:hypothetical protein
MSIADYDTLVCLVSEQPLPNLTAALDPRIGRDRIVLLESPRMRERADALAQVLEKHPRTVMRRTIDDSGDLPRFRAEIERMLGEFPGAALNATGGLKTMSILAFDAFRAAERPVFYVERDNRLIWLNPIDRPQLRLPGTLGLRDYFAAFGQRILQAQTEPDKSDGGVAMLDRLRDLPPPGNGDHNHVGQRFESLVFRATQAAARESGKPAHTEIAWGVKTAGPNEDEFDIVAVRDNVLHLVECKHSKAADLNSFLNKLDNLRRKRGITARAALVTTAPVPPNGGHARRARNSGILLLGRDSLPNLRQRLAFWLAGFPTAG